MINALSVDVEDYFMVENFASQVPFEDWEKFPLRLEHSLKTILALLKAHEVRATFFILGWVAERLPKLIQSIAEAGHEIGCHGYSHRPLPILEQDQFQKELRQAKKILQEVTGQKVIGFRAPTYSINRQTPWAFDILAEEGFLYDSSYRPFLRTHFQEMPFNQPKEMNTLSGKTIIEFPISVHQWMGLSFPIYGGGYFRLFPVGWVEKGIEQFNQKKLSANVHFHPWELDIDQPRMKTKPWTYFRHYVNLSKVHGKLEYLFERFHFSTLKEVLDL